MARLIFGTKIWLLLFAVTAAGVVASYCALGQNRGMPRRTTLEPDAPSIRQILFSPDGKYLFVGGHGLDRSGKGGQSEGELSIWELTNRKRVESLRLPQWVRSLALSEKGDLLAVSCGCTGTDASFGSVDRDFKPQPGQVRLYDFPSMKLRATHEEGYSIDSVDISPDGTKLATASNERLFRVSAGPMAKIKIWDTQPFKLVHEIHEIQTGFSQVKFSPDGKTLCFLDYRKFPKAKPGASTVIRQIEATSGKEGMPINIDAISFDPLHFTSGGKKVTLSGAYYWSLESGAKESAVETVNLTRQTYFPQWSFSRDEKWRITTSTVGTPSSTSWVSIWDIEARKEAYFWTIPSTNDGYSKIFSHALSPDKKTLAIGHDKVYLYDLK